MASPFSVFRRHQKAMFVALTILVMFAFVFLEPLMDAFRDEVQTNPVVVATRRYGDLREHDISTLIHQRQIVLNVLEQALVRGGMHPAVTSFQIQRLFGPPTEESVVNAWLLAQRADALGMVVDDRAVNEFLNMFLEQATEGRVRVGEISEILKRDKIPERVLFAALRRELLAQQLRQSFQTSLWATPPMQRWDYYLRLNRRATIELVPVSVVDFMDQIESPGEGVLRAFFDEHKERAWRPDMPEPAFRQPKKIALQYIKAEFDDFVDPDSVTQDEVLAYYEENKDTLFLRPQTPAPKDTPAPDEADKPAAVEQPMESPVEPPTQPAPLEEEPADAPAPSEAAEPAAEKTESAAEQQQPAEPAEEPAEPMEESATEPAEEPAEPMEEPATEPAEEPAEPAEEPAEPMEEPAEPMEEPAEPMEEPVEPKEGKAGESEDSEGVSPQPSNDDGVLRSGGGALFSFASFAEEPAQEDAPSSDESMPEPAGPVAESPSLEVPAAPGPMEEPASPERSTIGGQPAEFRVHLPLSEVEGEIRHTLARRKAHQAIEELLRSLSARLKSYHDELTLYEVREGDPTAKPPAELDVGKLAAEHDLKSYTTRLLSPWEVQALDIGSSMIDGSVPFIRHAFEELPPLQPAISQAEQDYFLFWKTDQREEIVPDWEDENVKEQVLEAWKLVEARKLARDRAEQLAEAARKSGKPLKEVFADDPKHDAVHAGPFSWMTYGDIPPMLAQEPPRISEVEGVDFTGQQFMRDVFALNEGELGVTMNQPQTFAYVVRMDSLVPSQTVLWEGFLADSFGKYAAAGAPDFQQAQAAWQKSIEEAAGLQWKRTPHRARDLD
ncbi:MAG: hypothetical protein RBS80_08620 [Thermoguttaceae bacterium]|nr:hypothetical protein [Thermoguttaceae bacterium]